MSAKTIIRFASLALLLTAAGLASLATVAAASPATTAIVIDGRIDDWKDHTVIGTDPAGDQVPGTPDLREIRAFSNDRFFYVLATLHEDGRTDHYDILMDVDGVDYDYQVSVWPRENRAMFATFPVKGAMQPIAGVTSAQGDKTIEVKLPLSAIGGKPVKRVLVQAYLGDRDGDKVENLTTEIANEVEPTTGAAAPASASGPRVNVTRTGFIAKDETWRGEIHLTGDVVLARDVTLTIEPGTTVYLASNSDDRHQGEGFDDDYTRGHGDPVRLAAWGQSTITIHLVDGILQAVGTAEKPITFRPEGDSTSPAQWDGIHIGRGTLQHAVVLYGGRSAVQIWGTSTGVEIAHNQVRHFMWAGIDVFAHKVWVHDNIVEGGGHQAIGARFDALVEHNLIVRSNCGIGVEMADGTTLRNNVILDSAVGIDVRNGGATDIRNNTIARIKGPPDGFYYQGKLIYPAGAGGSGGVNTHIAGPMTILNNIVDGQQRSAFGLGVALKKGSQVDYNLTWHTQSRYSGPNLSAVGQHNLSGNPRFVDAAKGDFHLASKSPATDAGEPAIRDPDNSPSDLGAYGGPQGKW